MTNNNSNPNVDFYFDKAGTWQEEIRKVRTIVLDCPLTEELKWGVPCYTYGQSNILLIQQTENVQAGRQIRFTNMQEITDSETILKEYIDEAIEVEKSGLEVPFKKSTEFKVPDELQAKFAQMPALKTAFEALTPGRQRAYLLHFSAPKQSQTRESRIEKSIPQILDGKGLND